MLLKISVGLVLGFANWPAILPIRIVFSDVLYDNKTDICNRMLSLFFINSPLKSENVSAQSPP